MKKGNKNRRNVQKNVNYDSDNQLMSLFKIIGVLVLLFGVFYGITLWRTKENVLDEEKVDEVTIQYDEILIGTLLKQNVDEYYVLVADVNGRMNIEGVLTHPWLMGQSVYQNPYFAELLMQLNNKTKEEVSIPKKIVIDRN